MLADIPAIRAAALRLQSSEFSDTEATLCIAIALALTALAWAILSPEGDK
jgi:hypothetical protein